MANPSGTSSDDSLSLLKALAEAAGVFVALTFVGGWSFLASYYKVFGLNPLELDFSVPLVSTTGVVTLYDALRGLAWWRLVFGAFLACLLAALLYWLKLRRGWIVAGLTILLFGVIGVGVHLGRSAALEDMQASSANLPEVTFFTSKLPLDFKNDLPACVLFKDKYDPISAIAHPCKLLLHSGKLYFFFVPPEVSQRNLALYTVRESEIEAIHVERGIRK
jgi:hypothetical protein